MANRILRDWTSSELIDKLSPGAEIFFTRLIMKADDYGSFYANPKLIRSALFPLREYKDEQVFKWVNECIDTGILFRYVIENREYIRIINFGQRLRNMRSTFPQPADNSLSNGGDLLTTRGESRPETKRNRNEVETETNSADADSVWPDFNDFWDLYDKKVDRPKCESKWDRLKQREHEAIMDHLRRYVQSTPDKQFRKHPATYLNNKSWENEITVSMPQVRFEPLNKYKIQ